MKKICTLFLFLLLTNCNTLFSQSKNAPIQLKKLYYYSFEGQLNSQDISALENKLMQLPYVILTKVKYKADSQKGLRSNGIDFVAFTGPRPSIG